MLLKSSTNRKRIRLFHNWTRFVLSRFMFGCAWLWLAEKFLQKRRWFFFFVVATHLFCKAMCSITAKQHNYWFLILERNIQNVVAGFALFTVVETSRFLGWNVKHFSFLHIGQFTSPIVSCTLLSTHKSFFLCLGDWIGTLLDNFLSVDIFLAKKKRVLSVFVVFTCSCNVKGTLWTKK